MRDFEFKGLCARHVFMGAAFEIRLRYNEENRALGAQSNRPGWSRPVRKLLGGMTSPAALFGQGAFVLAYAPHSRFECIHSVCTVTRLGGLLPPVRQSSEFPHGIDLPHIWSAAIYRRFLIEMTRKAAMNRRTPYFRGPSIKKTRPIRTHLPVW